MGSTAGNVVPSLTPCPCSLQPSVWAGGVALEMIRLSPSCRAGGACTAAAFLKEFVTAPHWAHLDIAGVMANKDEVPYLRKGMAGRPTRTLVEFAARLSQDSQSPK